ncbi:hypothetical protein VQH23_16150 [Pararoseomonas sp. SCSIO 73927]|uniref:hypothetical protein n=1 Tax=Pararoseomonas sp. SCSIO 73927 TaxID=3114537 RepID=UPI0030D60467
MPTTYIVLADDGRHVSLTRGGMPCEADQHDAGYRLAQQGQGGWLVRMDGDYWAMSGRLDLTEQVMLAPTSTTFFDAGARFRALRRAALGLPPSEPESVAA